MYRILVVEDVTFIRKASIASLTKYRGIACFEADNIVGAIEILESNPINMILLDIDLGNAREKCEVTDGLALIEAMEIRGVKRPEIIVVSGNVDDTNVLRAYKKGIKHYLRKPYTVNELLKKVAEVGKLNMVEVVAEKAKAELVNTK